MRILFAAMHEFVSGPNPKCGTGPRLSDDEGTPEVTGFGTRLIRSPRRRGRAPTPPCRRGRVLG